MSKINPGSNVHGDNDVQTARPGGLQDTDILEPMIGEVGKLRCPICSEVFNSREAYISHALSKHQTIEQPKETMEKSKETMEQNKDRALAILAPVPYDHGFHFFTAVGHYTGETAISLATFAMEVEVAPIESIDFHFKRADFQKWINETIGDTELATEIEQVEKLLTGEPLRQKLLRIINARVEELENQM